MSQQLFNFVLVDGTTVSESFNVQPTSYPTLSGPKIICADPLTFSGSATGSVISLFDQGYKVELNKKSSINNWFIQTTGSNQTASANIVSGSYYTASLSTVYFDFVNFQINPLTLKRVALTLVNDNVGWQNSFVLGASVFYVPDANGNLTLPLVPAPIKIVFEGQKKNTPFIILPSGSACTASQVMVRGSGVSNLITAKNQANYGYTAQASDNRYVFVGGQIDNAISASFALTASALTTSPTISGSTKFVGVIDLSALSSIDGPQLLGVSGTDTIEGVNIGTGLQLIGNSLSTTSALSASYSVTSSYATTANSASYANTSSWALNAVNGGTTLISGSTYLITASFAVSASRAVRSATATSASYASTASYCNFQTSSTFGRDITILPNPATDGAYLFMKNTAGLTTTLHVNDFGLNCDNDFYAENVHSNFVGDGTLVTGVISCSYANNATTAGTANSISFVPVAANSASWVSASAHIINADSASFVPNLYPQVLQTTVLSASWVSASAFITTAQTASYVQGSNVNGTVANANTAGTANAISFVPVAATSASWVSASALINSSSYANTASFSVNSANAYAISFVPIAANSASWVSASAFITLAQTASLALTASYVSQSTQTGIMVGDGINIVTAGTKGFIAAASGMAITGWQLWGDVTGSVTFDIYKASSFGIPPVSSICGTQLPSITNDVKNSSTTIDSWNSTLALGDWLAFNVTGSNNFTRLNLRVFGIKT